MISGAGSISKLQAFYGVSSPVVNQTHLTADGHNGTSSTSKNVGAGVLKSATLDAVLDPPTTPTKRGSRADSFNSSELSFEETDANGTTTTTKRSSRRWSLPSPNVLIPEEEGKGDYFTSAMGALHFDQPPPSVVGNKNALKSPVFGTGGVSAVHGGLAASNRPLPSLAPHTSVRKLVSLLGTDDRIDVPLKEISHTGLSALLESKLPLCYFLTYLLKEHNSEILFFVLDVQNFEQTLFESTSAQNKAAQDIFKTYLAANSLMEINTTHKSRRSVIQGVQQGLRYCFASSQEETMLLLDQAFELFRKSSMWDMMSKSIGSSVVVAKEKVEDLKGVVCEVLEKCYLGSEEALRNTRRNGALREKVPKLLRERAGLYL
jgi:hypothetical protein